MTNFLKEDRRIMKHCWHTFREPITAEAKARKKDILIGTTTKFETDKRGRVPRIGNIKGAGKLVKYTNIGKGEAI